MVDLTGVSWNQVSGWLSRMAALRPLMPTRELQQD